MDRVLAETYPDAVKQIVKSGFDIAGHGYTQDQRFFLNWGRVWRGSV